MSEREAIHHYSPEPNILERKAAEYVRRTNGGSPREWRERNPAEIKRLRRITRRAVTFAAIAGILSGGLIGGTEVWIRYGIFDGAEDLDWRETLPYWIAFFAFTGIVSAIEIAFLYAVALRALGKVSLESGLELGNDGGYPELFSRSLGRAALELPNPRRKIFGVDPYAYIPRWRLLAFNIAYKIKVGVTSFLLRIFMRRVLARLAVRGFIPLIAGPLYAAWNAIILWKVVREGRLRALGPFAVENGVKEVFGEGSNPSEEATELILQGVSEMIRRSHDAHPNYFYLLARLRKEMDLAKKEINVDWSRQSEVLGSLERREQEQVLNVLALAAILGTRLNRLQRSMLEEICDRCKCSYKRGEMKHLRKRLRDARAITAKDLSKVWK